LGMEGGNGIGNKASTDGTEAKTSTRVRAEAIQWRGGRRVVRGISAFCDIYHDFLVFGRILLRKTGLSAPIATQFPLQSLARERASR
jgi:hypothetical protein